MRSIFLPIAAALAVSLVSMATAQVRPPPVAPTPQALLVAHAGSDSVHFAPNGHELSAQARTTLAAQAMYLNLNPTLRARVEGYSDERGTREYSLGIAERRAAAVRNYLVSLGVESARLTVVSWGKERPANGLSGPVTWALSRRVRTVIEP